MSTLASSSEVNVADRLSPNSKTQQLYRLRLADAPRDVEAAQRLRYQVFNVEMGEGVLPFRAPLLAPLVDNAWQVTPAFLRYELEPGDGAVEDEVAYYRPETVLGPHLLNLLGKRRVRATLTYGASRASGTDRKALASRLRGEVCALGGIAAEAVGSV